MDRPIVSYAERASLRLPIGGCQSRDRCPSRLSEGTRVTRQAITRQVYAIDDAGLVHHARRGRERVWALDLKRLEKAQRYLDQMAAQWNDAANRLNAFVEGA